MNAYGTAIPSLLNPDALSGKTMIKASICLSYAFCSQENCKIIAPGDRHWTIFQKLCQSSNARGNLIPDAYHAALAIESGSEWITQIVGFGRY